MYVCIDVQTFADKCEQRKLDKEVGKSLLGIQTDIYTYEYIHLHIYMVVFAQPYRVHHSCTPFNQSAWELSGNCLSTWFLTKLALQIANGEQSLNPGPDVYTYIYILLCIQKYFRRFSQLNRNIKCTDTYLYGLQFYNCKLPLPCIMSRT